MRKEVIAPILVLLMLVGMGSYAMMNNDSTGDESPDEGIDDNQFSDEWDVYYVDSGSDLPACGSATLGRLYYVASTAGFETCTSAGWAFVNLTGPAGPSGPDGVDGVNGTDGADGVDGVNGTDGADGEKGEVGEDGDDGMDGMSALAVTTPETAGSNCADGGLKIEVGVDGNGNGSLDSNEVSYTEYVCNGADGANGSASPNTMLTSVSTPTLQDCSSGGRIIEQGHDNGDGGGTSQNGVLESGEVDYTTTYCSNFVVNSITDIRDGFASGYASDITVMGTRLYFEATDGISGKELWAHEITNDSTWQVANIQSDSGCASGCSGYADDIVVMGTRLFFEATDGITGHELWAHEAKTDTTWQVADIWSGGSSGQPSDLVVMGTRLYFQAKDSSANKELWAHETTNDSTWQVAEIGSGNYPGYASDITVMGTRLYFEATDGVSGYELWAHETTNDSTWQVADINSGSGPGYANDITVMGTRLYFEATDGNSGMELWVHETTNGSTWQAADINSGSSSGYANDITAMGTRLYFEAADGVTGYELWVHETICGCTWQIADINSGPASGYANYIMVMGTRLYFESKDGNSGYELSMMEIEHTIKYS